MFNISARKVIRNGLIFQVPISPLTNQRFTVHPDGTGTSWDESAPDIDQPHGLDYRSHQDIRKAVRIRLQKEHKTPASSSAGGEHLPGGCRILGIVENTTDLSTGAGDKTGIDITDGLFKGRGLIFDQTNKALWCFTGDGTVSDDPYRIPIHPDKQYSGGDITWTGGHEFDATVDFTNVINVDGTVKADSLEIDGTETSFGGTDGLGLFYDPTAYAGGETCTFPNGLIIKMGVKTIAVAAWGSYDVSFGTAFPNAIVSVVTQGTQNGPVDRNEGQVTAKGVTGFTFYGYDDINWIAVGY